VRSPTRLRPRRTISSCSFWGDYNTLVSTSFDGVFIYTDARNGVGCRRSTRTRRAPPQSPHREDVCPAQFGNTDAYVSTIAP